MTRRSAIRDQRGAVALMMALILTALLIVVAMVLDFGIVRVDRQANKAAADAAAQAGATALAPPGIGEAFPYAGVCQALRYLKVSTSELQGLSGAWYDGNKTPLGLDACTDAGLLAQPCDPADLATWARWEGTSTDGRVHVRIQSGYLLTDGNFSEENLAPLQADLSAHNGCDQLAVIVSEKREPGLGGLATDAQLGSSVRSVGRVQIGDGDNPVALLLLEQHDCLLLSTAGGGAKIHVLGTPQMTSVATGKVFPPTPGVIHGDSLGDGDDCSSGNYVFDGGNQSRSIVADDSPDSLVPGQITVVALSGAPGAVPGKAAAPYDEVVAEPGPPSVPYGRELLTREPVDDMYLADVRTAVTDAQNTVFAAIPNAAAALAQGWKVIGCSPTAAALGGITATDNVYVNCAGPPGFKEPNVTINGDTVFFNGFVTSSATNLSMPNATRVYVYGDSGPNAAGLDASGGFSMHDFGSGDCVPVADTSPTSSSKAQLFIKHGQLKQTGAVLRLCHTTVIMMGGRDDACLPTAVGTAPTATPCGGTAGTAKVSISGGSQDWTAPNVSNDPDQDKSGLEDLALWDESYGDGSNFQMSGTGAMTLRGVFMIPNAAPFNIKGGGSQDVVDSQYIASKLRVTGGGTMIMQPRASAIRIPPPPEPTLVR